MSAAQRVPATWSRSRPRAIHGYSAGQFVSVTGSERDLQRRVPVAQRLGQYVHLRADRAAASFTSGTPPATAVLVQEVTIAETDTAPPGYGTVKSTFVAYTCVVAPADHDSNPSTPNRWTGSCGSRPPVRRPGPGQHEWHVQALRYTGDYVSAAACRTARIRSCIARDGRTRPPELRRHRRQPCLSNRQRRQHRHVQVHEPEHDGAFRPLSMAARRTLGTNSGGANSNGGISTPSERHDCRTADVLIDPLRGD